MNQVSLRIVLLLSLVGWSPFVHADLISALKDCLAEAQESGVVKRRAVRKYQAQLECQGSVAKNLYDEVQFITTTVNARTERGERGSQRVFGSNTQCVRYYESADRRPTDDYSGFIVLDLDSAAVNAL